jgi:hypothetical protein
MLVLKLIVVVIKVIDDLFEIAIKLRIVFISDKSLSF